MDEVKIDVENIWPSVFAGCNEMALPDFIEQCFGGTHGSAGLSAQASKR